MDQLDRCRGALLGLAAGDAVGTTVEFMARGNFAPVTDMTGGGPFHLQAGQWTDDTSMALCLAASLVERGGFDARDQDRRSMPLDGHRIHEQHRTLLRRRRHRPSRARAIQAIRRAVGRLDRSLTPPATARS